MTMQCRKYIQVSPAVVVSRHALRDRRLPSRSAHGFTLIELMIVVAVVGILMAVAVPAYNDSVRKGRRGQAKADLMELAQILERHYTVHGSYIDNRGGDSTDPGDDFALPITQSPKTGDAFYVLAANPRTATTYTLTATPQGGQAEDRCGTLSITHTGQKSATGGTQEQCF